MTNIEPRLQSNCRWIVQVCGRVLCKPGKQLPQEFKSKEAAIRAGENHLAIARKFAGV